MQKYELKKTIRFELLPKENVKYPEIDNQNTDKNLKLFLNLYENASKHKTIDEQKLK